MRICKIEIKNFKSIRHVEMHCGPVTALLGPNNHGKSNVLQALDFFLNPGNKVRESDFCFHRSEGDDLLWVEVTFCELSPDEEKKFARYLFKGQVRIRKTALLEQRPRGNKVQIAYYGWLSEPQEAWLKAGYAAEVKKATLHPELAPYLPKVRFSKAAVAEAQQAYIDAHRDEIQYSFALEGGPFLGSRTVPAGIFPDAFMIPAVRDLTDETKTKATSLFGRLLNRTIGEMAEADAAFQSLRDGLIELVRRLNRAEDGNDERPTQLRSLETRLEGELSDWDVKLDIRISPPEIEKVFELGTSLHVYDGVATPAEEKGHGLQRALIFALTRAWAGALRRQAEANATASSSVTLLVEEPELYLHPHAQRLLNRNLRAIAKAEHHQVILCTHSPQFVDITRERDIVMIHKPSPQQGTCVRQSNVDLFTGDDNASRKQRFNLGHWINPERAELFFARRVIFVEGATERVLLPYLAERLDIYDTEVSIIDCGSKFSLPIYMELAGAFGLDHMVIHDEDPVPEGLEGNRLRQALRTFELNDEILALAEQTGSIVRRISPDFEGATGISKAKGHRMNKPLAALDHFHGLALEDIPPTLREIIEEVYAP